MNAYSEGAFIVFALLAVFAFAGVGFGLFGAIAWAVGRFVYNLLVSA